MESMAVCLLVLLGVGVPLTAAIRIDGVCTPPPTASGMARPSIPNDFRVDVECSMIDQNRSIFVREYFDYNSNRGRIRQIDSFNNADIFFDYNDNEVISFDTLSNGCVVGDLSTSQNRWMFGYKAKQGMPHVFGASGALHFGDSPEQYVGKSSVRGILVDQWDSCQYSDVLNATMKVTWYFSAKTEWDMQLGARTTPVRAVVVGKLYVFGLIRPFSHQYDLFNFRVSVDPEDFEIPVGVVCPGRVKTKPFPQLPTRFSFTGETINYEDGSLSYLRESYDQEAKINVFRYKQFQDTTTFLSADRMLQVNDYSSGISYVIDTLEGSCQKAQIGHAGYAFADYLPNGKVMMKNPAQFFAVASSSAFTYAGVRTTRDIPCELWVAKSNTINGYVGRNLTIEWFFAVSGDGESWKTYSQYRMPVQFRMWELGEDQPVWEFNVFYFDVDRPKLINVDISPCFRGSQRRRFTFDIDGSSRSAVFNNVEMFKYAVSSALTLYTGISPLQVADIKLYDDVGVIHVTFDLLDKPKLAGDSANSTLDNGLAGAVQMYNDVISRGGLQLSVVVGTNVQKVMPVVGTAAEISSSPSGYTAGALAGLGVAMLVVGSAGGAGAAFFFFK